MCRKIEVQNSMSEQLFSTSVRLKKILCKYFLKNSLFFHFSQENLPEFFFSLQVDKDKGSSRKAVYFKFGMAGIFAVEF